METPSAGRASAGVAPSAGSATRITVSTFGAMAGLAGIEHGIGEILQGGAAPEGVMILSWPDSGFFRILGGEPAMTVVPDLLVTGVLGVAGAIGLVVTLLAMRTAAYRAILGVNSNIVSRSGGSVGVGFAIPMEQVRFTARQILETGEAEYPVIGASVRSSRSRPGARRCSWSASFRGKSSRSSRGGW